MNKVKVYAPSGKLVAIPEENLSKALERGARLFEEPKAQPQPLQTETPGPSVMDRINTGLTNVYDTSADFLNKARSGVALGFSDELAGVGGVIGETAGALADGQLPSQEELVNAYNTSRQEDLDSTKASEERSPVASLLGGVAGSGVGVAASGLAGAGRALGARVLGSSVAPATSAALGTGLLTGAVEGAGTAKTLADVPANAATGAGVGLAGAGLGVGLGKVANRVLGPGQNKVLAEQLDEAYKLGQQDKGSGLFVRESLEGLARDKSNVIGAAAQQADELAVRGGQAVEEAIGDGVGAKGPLTLEKLQNSLAKFINSQKEEGIEQATKLNRLNDATDELAQLKAAGNRVLNQPKNDPKLLADQLKAATKNLTTREMAAQPTTLPLSLKGLIGVTNTAKIRAANTVGGLEKNSLGRAVRSVFDAPREALDQLSQELASSQNPAIRKYGEALMSGVEKGTFYKNAALFNIMQNPETRGIAKSLTGVEAEEE